MKKNYKELAFELVHKFGNDNLVYDLNQLGFLLESFWGGIEDIDLSDELENEDYKMIVEEIMPQYL